MNMIKYIIPLSLVICCQFVVSCNKETSKASDSDNGESQDSIEFQVGTKTFKTVRRTSDGHPVVPMWNTRMATDNPRTGAGFLMLDQAEHTYVWQPPTRADGAYNHYACLLHHNGRFYAMWGNHEFGEDAPGQRVLYATSETWGEWTGAKELYPAPGPVLPRGDSGIHLKPDRWAVIDDVPYAITYVHGAGAIYPIARSVGGDGELGEPFLVEDLPSTSSLPVNMQGPNAPTTASPLGTQLHNWYRENDQIHWWASASWGVQRTAADGKRLIESFIYRAKDGGLVLMLRCWGNNSNPVHNNRMYVSFNDGQGGWAAPHPSDIPDSPSRGEAVTLEDGTVLLIGNQIVNQFDQALHLDRDPITISVSKDGYTFDEVYTLRTNSPTEHRFSGVTGRGRGFSYPSAIVVDDWLYIFYSIGKEDMGVSRVPLQAFGL